MVRRLPGRGRVASPHNKLGSMHVLLLAADSNQSSGSILGLFPLLLIPVAMYFLMIRPQRRRQREQAALQSSIEVGDEVMTTSGVYGFVTQFDGDIVWLEIDDNVQIRIAKAAVQRKVDTAKGETALPAVDSKGRSTPIKPSEIVGADADTGDK
jgi:preprotein translocase subunit YajC